MKQNKSSLQKINKRPKIYERKLIRIFAYINRQLQITEHNRLSSIKSMVLGQTGNIRIDRMLDMLSKKVRKCIMFLNIEKIEIVKKNKKLFVIFIEMDVKISYSS